MPDLLRVENYKAIVALGILSCLDLGTLRLQRAKQAREDRLVGSGQQLHQNTWIQRLNVVKNSVVQVLIHDGDVGISSFYNLEQLLCGPIRFAGPKKELILWTGNIS